MSQKRHLDAPEACPGNDALGGCPCSDGRADPNCGDFAAQLNILVCSAAHFIKSLDISATDLPKSEANRHCTLQNNETRGMGYRTSPLPSH